MKPPAEINAEVVMPSGNRIRWDVASPDAKNRPLNPTIETESSKGFGNGGVTLHRPTGRDYPELGLLNELILRTATGKTVYQGRAQGVPVSDEWQFDCDGWWSHGEQRTCTPLLVDRSLSAWGDASLTRRSGLIPTWNSVNGPTVEPDTTGTPGVTLKAAAATVNPYNEAWYDAGVGNRVASIYYDMISKSLSTYGGDMFTATDDSAGGAAALLADVLTGTNSSAAGTATATTPARYALFRFYLSGGTVGAADQSMSIRRLAVYGDTGIPKIARGGSEPDGIAASAAITYLANTYCPKWDTSGVQATSYPIPHVVWRDPITPFEAIKQLNSYHLWKLGVWEERKLKFEPYDLTVADWQVANGVDGVRVEYQGDTTENMFNGCCVSYSDFSGTAQRITPDDTAVLRDSSEWIAANQWGDQAWMSIDVSWPCSSDDAAQIGSIALTAANQAKRPSTITVPMHIKDINGAWWPSSYVRADQTIVVTNQHTPVPRLITKTSWSNHTLTITTDNAIDTIGAYNTRVGGALSANGLI